MADSSLAQVRPSEPTYYEILGLSAAALDDKDNSAQVIKRAYHRALLRHHPDKTSTPSAQSPAGSAQTGLTVDTISQAFAVLSDPGRRAEYDRALRLARTAGDGAHSLPHFQTGVEDVDLDDLEYGDDEDQQPQWYRGCRCGALRGYQFGEADLEEAADLGELMVGCHDCSLWLRVHFAVMDDDDDGAAAHAGDNSTSPPEESPQP